MKPERDCCSKHIATYVKKERNRLIELVVRDHCHFTGMFRGAVQQQCNLHYNIDKGKYKLPVVFHNLRGYDFSKDQTKTNNSERYISFSVGRLKFIDFMQLLSYSLETLAAQWNDDQFTHLKTAYPNSAQWSWL